MRFSTEEDSAPLRKSARNHKGLPAREIRKPKRYQW